MSTTVTELVVEDVLGAPVQVFAERFEALHEVLAASVAHGDRSYLVTLDGPLGTIMVVTPNDGSTPAEQGAPVGLEWSPSVVRVHRGAMAEAPDVALEVTG